MYEAGPVPERLKPSMARGASSACHIFVVAGVVLLVLLCIVPVWNAIALLEDSNYVFWVGTSMPCLTIFLLCSITLLYALTITAFFSTARPQVQTEQTVLMIANIFITLLGLVLVLLALPLSRHSLDTYNNLMHRCDYSEQTHRLYEYSQVLQNIRSTADCAPKYSVEECVGYEDAWPYTSFLKHMEEEFRCSGFCYRSPQALQAAQLPNQTAFSAVGATVLYADAGSASDETTAAENSQEGAAASESKVGGTADSTSLFFRRSQPFAKRRQHVDHVTPLGLLAVDSHREGKAKGANIFAKPTNTLYPPTLFSDANYQASCEGMAARDMKNFSGDIAFQTFYQGIYLVLIAVATGFLKLIGFCIARDKDVRYFDGPKGVMN